MSDEIEYRSFVKLDSPPHNLAEDWCVNPRWLLAEMPYNLWMRVKALEAVAAAARAVAATWPVALTAERVLLVDALDALDKEAGGEARRDKHPE